MGSEGVFSAEMPDGPFPPIVPLDADTAERLLSGRLDPDDAPPGYAEVARLLQAAAAPADPAELAGQAAAVDAFHTAHDRSAQRPGHPAAAGRAGGSGARRGAASGPRRGVRGRVVALALAGVVAAGGVVAATGAGLWTAGGAPSARELGSPSGGPSAGGSSSGTPGSGHGGSGAYGPGVYGSGSLRPVGPGLESATGTAPVRDGRPRRVPPTARERATARHGGGVTARGGSPHGVEPARPGKQPKPKPPKPKPKSGTPKP
jgi:hypothetical protein